MNADIDVYVDEMMVNATSYTDTMTNKQYSVTVAGLITNCVLALHHFLKGDHPTAMRLAEDAVRLCCSVNYLCVGVAWALCLPVVVFRSLNRRDRQYYLLINMINRYRVTYPCYSMVVANLVPDVDFTTAAQMLETPPTTALPTAPNVHAHPYVYQPEVIDTKVRQFY